MNPSRDLQYEQENIGYDSQYPEGGIKCKNYELCQGVLPPNWFELFGTYLCPTCDGGSLGFGWKELEFRQSNEDCAVCANSDKTQMKFPANCGHWFCVACSRNILFWKEQRYHLSPVPYGCPPCPKGCINPVKGEQCYCYEYDPIQDEWEQSNPEQYKKWRDAEEYSIELSETISGSVFGSKKCPLCRATYE